MNPLAHRAAAPLLGAALVALSAAGWARRRTESGDARPAPPLRIELDDAGAEIARVDDHELSAAFASWGLPDPPRFDGVEAVPVRVALGFAEAWREHRDGDSLGRLGSVYLAFEQFEHAVECFAAAAELGREREHWLYLLGAACHRMQWPRGAVEALEAARALDARQALTHARLGDLHLEAGRVQQALTCFDSALALAPNLSIAASGRARACASAGDLQQALASAQQAVRAQPGDFAARRTLADVLVKLGRRDDAAREAEIADRLPKYQGWGTFDPRLREAQALARSMAHMNVEINNALQRNDLASARALAEELHRRRPRDHGPLSVIATVAATTGDHARAREAIDQALELRPDDFELLTSSGEIALAAGDPQRALATAARVESVRPGAANASQLRGRALFLLGRREEGLAEARRAVNAEPEAVEHRAVLLEMLRLAERHADARALLEESATYESTRAWAQGELTRAQPKGGSSP